MIISDGPGLGTRRVEVADELVVVLKLERGKQKQNND